MRNGPKPVRMQTSEYDYNGDVSGPYAHGTGELTLYGRGVYCGSFVRGRFDGFGKLELCNGTRFEGMFVEGLPHGSGYLDAPDRYRYQGEFARGKFHGRGRLYLYRLGREFIGNFAGEIFEGGEPEMGAPPINL